MGLREAERAKPLAVGRGPGALAGYRLHHPRTRFPSLPLRCRRWHLAVPRCSPSPGRDGGCTRRPPQNQNQPLSNSQLKLCLVNYSAAHSRCFSVLIRRAWRWGKGKKKKTTERKEKEQPRAPKQLRCQRQRFNECACGSPEQMSTS